MTETKKAWLARIALGGLFGWAVLLLIGFIAGSFTLWGAPEFHGFVFTDGTMEHLLGSEALAVAVQFLLFFLLGAGAGVATLPFADGGKELLLRSALHFLYMEGLTALTVWLNFAGHESPLPWMAALALLYVLIWGIRWIFWWFELGAIREKLGLTRRKRQKEEAR